jgi:hypothetical protein
MKSHCVCRATAWHFLPAASRNMCSTAYVQYEAQPLIAPTTAILSSTSSVRRRCPASALPTLARWPCARTSPLTTRQDDAQNNFASCTVMLLGSSVKVGGAAAPRRIFALQRAFDLVLRRCLPRKPAVCIDKANECAAGRCASTFASCRLVLPSTNANTAGTRRCGGVFALPCTFRCRCVVNQTCRRPCARTRPPLAPPDDAKRLS